MAVQAAGSRVEAIEAVTWEGDAERDKVASVNPMRRIPALVTLDGETIAESVAILIWLAEQYPEGGGPLRGLSRAIRAGPDSCAG